MARGVSTVGNQGTPAALTPTVLEVSSDGSAPKPELEAWRRIPHDLQDAQSREFSDFPSMSPDPNLSAEDMQLLTQPTMRLEDTLKDADENESEPTNHPVAPEVASGSKETPASQLGTPNRDSASVAAQPEKKPEVSQPEKEPQVAQPEKKPDAAEPEKNMYQDGTYWKTPCSIYLNAMLCMFCW